MSKRGRSYRVYKFHCFAERKDGVYVGYCLEAGVVSSGLTVDEVRNNLHEAIRAYMVYVRSSGNYRLLRRGSSLRVWAKYIKVRLLLAVLHVFGRLVQLCGDAKQRSLGYLTFPIVQEAVC